MNDAQASLVAVARNLIDIINRQFGAHYVLVDANGDIAPPTDCDALGMPTFEERHAANDAALEELREFVYGS